MAQPWMTWWWLRFASEQAGIGPERVPLEEIKGVRGDQRCQEPFRHAG
jgi:hypothetical protein